MSWAFAGDGCHRCGEVCDQNEALEKALRLAQQDAEGMRRELLMGLISTIRYLERVGSQPIDPGQRARIERYEAFIGRMKQIAGKYTMERDILR